MSTKRLKPRTDMVPDPFRPGQLVLEAHAGIHPGLRLQHAVSQRFDDVAAGKVHANGQDIDEAAADRATMVAGIAAGLNAGSAK